MKIADLDRLQKGDIVILTEGASHDPNLIGYYAGDKFLFHNINNTGSVTSINVKGLNKISTMDRGHIHMFSVSVCKHMECLRSIREDKLEEFGI